MTVTASGVTAHGTILHLTPKNAYSYKLCFDFIFQLNYIVDRLSQHHSFYQCMRYSTTNHIYKAIINKCSQVYKVNIVSVVKCRKSI